MHLQILGTQVTLCRKQHFDVLRRSIEYRGQIARRHVDGLISVYRGYRWKALLFGECRDPVIFNFGVAVCVGREGFRRTAQISGYS